MGEHGILDGSDEEDLANTNFAGNDIFDALEGAPGTFLVLDSSGTIGFGFDESRWSELQNIFDGFEKGYTQRLEAGTISDAGSFDTSLSLNRLSGWQDVITEKPALEDTETGLFADIMRYKQDVMNTLRALPPDLMAQVLAAVKNGANPDFIDWVLKDRDFPGIGAALQAEQIGIFQNDIWPNVVGINTIYSPPPIPPNIVLPPGPPPIFP